MQDVPAGTDPRPLLLVLTGPTGTGKSDWAIRAAEIHPVEIVSVDSAMVYRGLDIGTAKPSRELIDICDPAEAYSAGRFVIDATARIVEIHGRGRIPLLVGGTFLYLRALVSGMARLPEASPELRRVLTERASRVGWAELHEELRLLDPQAAARIAFIDGDGRVERIPYELCVLIALRDALRRPYSPGPPAIRRDAEKSYCSAPAH